MRSLILLAAAAALVGCTRVNPLAEAACTPGEQRACACPGGAQGAQACNAEGTGFDRCFGCPGDVSDGSVPDGGRHDLAGQDLTGGGNPCAVVMIVLDRSGSMGADFAGGSSSPSKMSAADDAVAQLVQNYGDRVPFGLTTFENSTTVCTDGVQILVEPTAGSAPAVESQVKTVMPGGSTNTGEAIAQVAADPNLMDAARPGSYLVLVTDGEPNCDTQDQSGSPGYTVSQISAAASSGIDTFVVGLGSALLDTEQSSLDQMAHAGKVPCSGGFCGGHAYYPAPTSDALAQALDLVIDRIVGSSPGGSCGGFACCSQPDMAPPPPPPDFALPPLDLGFPFPTDDLASPPPADMSTPPRSDLGTLPPCVCNPGCGAVGACVGPDCCLPDFFLGTCQVSSACSAS